MFSTYFNGTLNKMLAEAEISSFDQDNARSRARKLKAYAFLLMLPAVSSSIIMRAFSGDGLDSDDDGEYLDELIDMFFVSQARFFVAGIPIVGGIANYIIGKITGKAFNDKLSLSPVFSVLEVASDAPDFIGKLYDGEDLSSKDSRAVAYALGLATGLPFTGISKPGGYLLDVEAGNASPDGALDFTRGLVTGKKGN